MSHVHLFKILELCQEEHLLQNLGFIDFLRGQKVQRRAEKNTWQIWQKQCGFLHQLVHQICMRGSFYWHLV